VTPRNVGGAAPRVPNNPSGFIRTWRLHQLVMYGGMAAKRSAPTDKSYAAAMACSQPTANRRRNGDPYSPETQVLVTVERLSTGERSSALPLLAQAWITYMENGLTTRTDQWLAARRHELTLQKYDIDKAISDGVYLGDDDALLDAHSRAVELHAEIAGIIRVQKDRRKS
jgi:hypothetical protein